MTSLRLAHNRRRLTVRNSRKVATRLKGAHSNLKHGGPQALLCRPVRLIPLFRLIPGSGLHLALALLQVLWGAGCGDVRPTGGTGQANETGKAAGVDREAAKSVTGAPLQTLARFADVTQSSGVTFTYRDGQEAGNYAILESLGGGVALFDYDGDRALDVFLPGGGRFGPNHEILGRPGALFRNPGTSRDGTCQFQEVTALAGVQQAPYYSHGTAVGDYNSDGFPDLLVTGYGGLVLFQNQGDGSFVERAQAAGLTDSLWSSSAGWGDLNGDGVLDLFVAHYVNWSFENHPFCNGPKQGQREVCPPKKFAGLPDVLYFGLGDGTFRDGSSEAGLVNLGHPAGVSLSDSDKGLGVLLADVDLDGDLDIYVANDTVPKFLYRNKGNGTFDEVAWQSGAALSDSATADGSMGLDIGDFNLDGLPDLWVANYERESLALYRNEGDCQFLHVSRSTGVTAVGALFVSFGTLFLDFDRDGDEDIFVTNGHVIRYPVNAPLKQLPLLFENLGGRFVNVAPYAGACLAVPHLGRGVAGGDIDNDGDIDLVLSPINEPAAVLVNESLNDNHWLRVRLIGVKSQRDAVGAHVTLTTSTGKQTRQVKGGGSYLSQSDLSCFFGIPKKANIERLSVHWPSGTTQEVTNLAVDRSLVVIEK